jgi:formylglycine-generating enzyme required for sulfatase activity
MPTLPTRQALILALATLLLALTGCSDTTERGSGGREPDSSGSGDTTGTGDASDQDTGADTDDSDTDDSDTDTDPGDTGVDAEPGDTDTDAGADAEPDDTDDSDTDTDAGADTEADSDSDTEIDSDTEPGTSPLGATCTSDADCASDFCATAPDGTANDRCAPPHMVWIPAGTFTMGSPTGEVGRSADETQHSVRLTRPFFIDQTEVTQGAWKALSGGVNPSTFASCGDNCPVEQVDWYSAVAFANARSAAEGLPPCYSLIGCSDTTNGWKDGDHDRCTGATFVGLTCTGYRLPTESEWEYAARAGTTTATYVGNLSGDVYSCTTAQANLDGIAWWCRNSGSRTQAVGGKTANTWGLRDMLGNVWEWTWDRYGTYPGSVTDPLGATTGTSRVLRGGGWYGSAYYARAADRNGFDPVNRNAYYGFRLARTAP